MSRLQDYVVALTVAIAVSSCLIGLHQQHSLASHRTEPASVAGDNANSADVTRM